MTALTPEEQVVVSAAFTREEDKLVAIIRRLDADLVKMTQIADDAIKDANLSHEENIRLDVLVLNWSARAVSAETQLERSDVHALCVTAKDYDDIRRRNNALELEMGEWMRLGEETLDAQHNGIQAIELLTRQRDTLVRVLEPFLVFWSSCYEIMDSLDTDDVQDAAKIAGLLVEEAHDQPCDVDGCPCDAGWDYLFSESCLVHDARAVLALFARRSGVGREEEKKES